MGLTAERLNLRMFIDGIEVPVIGAKCTFAEHTVATASAQVIATDQIYDIEPRAFVTLFVYDNFDFIDSPEGERNAIRIGGNDPRRWKLLFSGEMVSISISKQASGRVARIECADPSNYWDFIRQHYINFNNAGVELFEAAFLGVKQDRLKFFDVLTQGAQSKLYIWLTQSKGKDGNANLYLGVQRILREMFFSVNDFYAEAFNRLRIGDTVVGLSEDETAAKLFKLQFFEKFIKSQVGGKGGIVTVRQLLDGLLGPVFHNYVTIPCPRFDRRGAALGFSPEEGSVLAQGLISRENSWPGASLNYTVIKPDTWFLAPPVCNVVFPHMYRDLTYGRNYLAEPTRMFLRTSLMFTGRSKWLTERFYAPDFKSFNDMLYAKGGYLERLAGTDLPHEKFVGLNPAIVWQDDLPAYVAKGPRREYLSQLTHYLFWKYKFGTRTVNVSGPLNLNLVPGYPGLVLDRVETQFGVTRHFQGNVGSVVHSVDQNGGWTHFNLVGARIHTEKVDFDEGGSRSLEEVVARGTDGYLDSRYDAATIGPEVYQKLFGCGSIADILAESERDTVTTSTPGRSLTAAEESQIRKIKADMAQARSALQGIIDAGAYDAYEPGATKASVSQELDQILLDGDRAIAAIQAAAAGGTTTSTDYIPAAVEKIHRLYAEVVKNGQNVDLFSSLQTNRPKATFPEMMGLSLTNKPTGRGNNDFSPGAVDLVKEQDPELAKYDGFYAAAVDPDAGTTKNGTYESGRHSNKDGVKAHYERVVVQPEISRPGFDAQNVISKIVLRKAIYKSVKIHSRKATVTVETATYPLEEDLRLRRDKVLLYIASLASRGLRG